MSDVSQRITTQTYFNKAHAYLLDGFLPVFNVAHKIGIERMRRANDKVNLEWYVEWSIENI